MTKHYDEYLENIFGLRDIIEKKQNGDLPSYDIEDCENALEEEEAALAEYIETGAVTRTMAEEAQRGFIGGSCWVTCYCGKAPASVPYNDGSTWVLTQAEKVIAEARHEEEFGPEANPALGGVPLAEKHGCEV